MRKPCPRRPREAWASTWRVSASQPGWRLSRGGRRRWVTCSHSALVILPLMSQLLGVVSGDTAVVTYSWWAQHGSERTGPYCTSVQCTPHSPAVQPAATCLEARRAFSKRFSRRSVAFPHCLYNCCCASERPLIDFSPIRSEGSSTIVPKCCRLFGCCCGSFDMRVT